MINVSILGYGTIGSGVFQVLKENCQIIAKRTGEEIRVKSILDLRDFPGDVHLTKRLLLHLEQNWLK